MKTVALPAAIMAGVTFYAAVYHTLLHVRTGRRTRLDAQFGLLAFGIALYAMFSSLLYMSGNVDEGAGWQRLQQATLSALVPVFLYFVDSVGEVSGPRLMRRASWLYCGMSVVVLVEHQNWLLTGEPSIKRIRLPWFGEVVYYEQAMGPLYYVICSALPLVLVYTLVVAARARRLGSTSRAKGLLVGVAAFSVGIANDSLLAAGALHSVYMIEYAFTSILLLVSYGLSAEVVAAARHTQAVAEREMAQADARRLESIGRLAGGVAHDLNNMLTPVVSYLELALRRIAPTAPEHHYVLSASDAAARAAALAQQLLALGRKQVLDVRPLDLGAGLKALAPLMQHLFSKQVKLEIEVPGEAPLIDADSSQLDQVWMNLAANARDAMPQGGRFSFRVEAAENGVAVSVRDTGNGMNPETAEHIFEPFFTTKPRGKGTGLGLSIVRGIVEQHEGTIDVQTTPGVGTTFRLWFPASTRSVARAATPSLSPAAASGRRSVLVVDDDEAIRTLVITLLEDAGYRVEGAASAHEVESYLERHNSLDLLLSDVILPDTDGPHIKQLVEARFPRVPCLFMTGHADGLLAHRGITDWDVEILRKPFTGDQLVRKIEDVLQRRAGRPVEWEGGDQSVA
ncbi:MAG: ATP-binding protein [Myxococcales bacterium]